MTTQGPGGNGTPEEPDGTPSGSEEVWLKFLTDSERAIRTSAPREPSAQERAPGWHPWPLDAGTTEQPTRRVHDEPKACGTEAVGDLWQPEEPWAGPAWRDLDGRARLRRVGRVIATAAAIALALGAWSLLSTGAGAPSDRPDDTTVQQLEEAPDELPTATSLPLGSAVAEPPSTAVTAG